MKPHKWEKEIKAWASGAEIEQADIRENANPHWYECINPPAWDTTFYQFRIKPQPKEPQYLYVYFNAEMVSVYKEPLEGWDSVLLGKIKLED